MIVPQQRLGPRIARLAIRRSLENEQGAVAQLGEHLLCKQGVTGSIPVSSTKSMRCFQIAFFSKGSIWKQTAAAR